MTDVPPQIVNARRTAGVMLVLSALATVIVLLMLFAGWFTQPPEVAASGSYPASTPVVITPTTTFAAPTTSVQPVSAEEALQQQVGRDRAQVETLVGYWVPQLSSKTVGLEADGIIYGYDEILDHFTGLKTRYPEVLLLRSDDYTSFTGYGYWVAVMPIAHSDGPAANSWCDNEQQPRRDSWIWSAKTRCRTAARRPRWTVHHFPLPSMRRSRRDRVSRKRCTC